MYLIGGERERVSNTEKNASVICEKYRLVEVEGQNFSGF